MLDDLLLVAGPRELEGLLEALVDLPRVRQLEEVEVLVRHVVEKLGGLLRSELKK